MQRQGLGRYYTQFCYFLLLALDLVERVIDVVEAECEMDGVTIKVVLSPDMSVNWSRSKVKQAPNLALSASSNALSACAWDRLGSRAWAQISNTSEADMRGCKDTDTHLQLPLS